MVPPGPARAPSCVGVRDLHALRLLDHLSDELRPDVVRSSQSHVGHAQGRRRVWCGVVGCGTVWYPMVWYGLGWRGAVWYCCGVVVWYCGGVVVWYHVGVVRCGVVWSGVVWSAMAWSGGRPLARPHPHGTVSAPPQGRHP